MVAISRNRFIECSGVANAGKGNGFGGGLQNDFNRNGILGSRPVVSPHYYQDIHYIVLANNHLNSKSQLMKTLIIDDEPDSHDALREHLSRHHPEVRIMDSGYSVEQGLELIRKYQPELLFLDIHMSDGTGFDLIEALDRVNFQVIFITAHNQYAQTAIRFGALDYLLKPIAVMELTTAILKAKLRLLESIQLAQMQIMRETLDRLHRRELPPKMSISTADGVLYFSTRDIIRLQAMQNFTEFKVANDSRRLIASFNLKKFENDLKPFEDFMRVHRSHLINLNKVVRLIRGEKCYVEMTDGSIVRVSKMHVQQLAESLSGMTV